MVMFGIYVEFLGCKEWNISPPIICRLYIYVPTKYVNIFTQLTTTIYLRSRTNLPDTRTFSKDFPPEFSGQWFPLAGLKSGLQKFYDFGAGFNFNPVEKYVLISRRQIGSFGLKIFRGVNNWIKNVGSTSHKKSSSWWLDQPLGRICSSKWVHLPQIGMKIFETTNL